MIADAWRAPIVWLQDWTYIGIKFKKQKDQLSQIVTNFDGVISFIYETICILSAG